MDKFITDRYGNQIYAKNTSNDEIYKRTYNFLNCYAYDIYGNEIYAKDRKGNELYCYFKGIPIPRFNKNFVQYAKDNKGNEYYPTINGEEFIFYTFKLVYAKKYIFNEFGKFQTEFYPNIKDKSVFSTQYALNEYNLEYYPKNEDGDEYAPLSSYIYVGNNPIYPVTKTKDIIYPKDNQQNEYYLRNVEGNLVIPFESAEAKLYAQLVQNVPFDKLTPRYALNNLGEVVFPKRDNESEYYITKLDKSNVIQDLTTYVKDEFGNELYPVVKQDCNFYKELPINKRYALKENKPYYPIDHFGIEYTIDTQDGNNEPLGTMIDNKGYEIISDPSKVPLEVLKGYIIHRPVHYATTKKSARKPRKSLWQGDYTYKSLDWVKNTKSTHWSIISVLTAILTWLLKWAMTRFMM